VHGESWTDTEHLLAATVDLLAWANHQRAQASTKKPLPKPKPLPRPSGKTAPAAAAKPTAAALRDWQRRHATKEVT
jgi:hypothetical protein